MLSIVELFLRWIHLVAGIIWFSGVCFSAFIATPVLNRNLPPVESLQHISEIRERLRPIIRLTIHVLLITGAMNLVIVGLLKRPVGFTQNYIVILGIKFGFVGLMTVFHSLHVSLFGQKLELAIAELNPDGANLPEAIVKLQKQTRLFAILTMISGLAVFALSVSLKNP